MYIPWLMNQGTRRKERTGEMELVTDAFSQIELAYASGQAGVAGICLLTWTRPLSTLSPAFRSSILLDFSPFLLQIRATADLYIL
jgi:hypothetical protein